MVNSKYNSFREFKEYSKNEYDSKRNANKQTNENAF